jgi:formate dehydrogenase subunit gamma
VRAPIAFWGGLLFALSVGRPPPCSTWIRGQLGTETRPGGRLIERFTPSDRMAHWLLGDSLGHAGHHRLILRSARVCCCPLIGYTLFSWLAALSKNLHNFVGPILIIAVP